MLSFRPLSGKWGYRFEDYIGVRLTIADMFPSPLGEMGLSIAMSNCLFANYLAARFPSPLGEMGLSILR